MAEITPLSIAEYPPEPTFFDVLKRMHEAGLTQEVPPAEEGHDVGLTATPEGFLALGSLLHLILGTDIDRAALSRLKAPELATALTAIGVRGINGRPKDGQHRG